jgi:methionyl-tRNA formyltransferase
MGAINVHFSLLPKYRGAAPVNWAIVNGETETGVTTMKMDAGLDTGDILLQKRIPIEEDDDSVSVMERLSALGAELIVETLSRFPSIEPVPQDNSAASIAPIMRKEDGVIDWEMRSERIRDRVRGFQPFPTSHTTFRNLRLTLWRTRVNDESDGYVTGKPGYILKSTGDDLIVECGSGTTLRILELQLQGKRRFGARDFINGVHPVIGERLGHQKQ